MIPLYNKTETFFQDEVEIDKSKHGYNRPVHVSDRGFRAKSETEFFNTIKAIGMKEIVDLQDFNQVEGFLVNIFYL
jgi:alcohol oxidase